MKELLLHALKGSNPRKTLLFLVLVPVLWFCVHLVFLLAAGLNDSLRKSDAAVVFGSEVLKDGTPSARLKARLAFQKCGIDGVASAHALYGFEFRDLYSVPREIFGYYACLLGQ